MMIDSEDSVQDWFIIYASDGTTICPQNIIMGIWVSISKEILLQYEKSYLL